jgi:predicted ABC-type sugar transport system permease subunit
MSFSTIFKLSNRGEWIRDIWSWIFLLVMVLFFEIWAQISYSSSFLFNGFNVQSILIFATAPLLLGIGQSLVIISGGIDLSVGFVMGFSAVVLATVVNSFSGEAQGLALAIGILITFLVCLIPGFINGFLVTKLKIPPFIGTLGMYGVARGAGFIIADGMTVPVNNDWLYKIGTGKILGIPISVLIAIITVIVFHFILSKTKFGQYTYAIGGNREAAIRSGINVNRHIILIFIISSFCAFLAGLVYTARFSAGAAQAGEPMLLDSIAAVFIGGASFYGGSGKIIGTVVGALVIAVIQFGLVFVDVDAFWQFLAVGLVIIVAVLIDQSKTHITGIANE